MREAGPGEGGPSSRFALGAASPSGLGLDAATAERKHFGAQAHLARAEVRQAIKACRACELWTGCHVPFSGPADARLIVVGEAPGERECEKGKPFVGRAGRLLEEGLNGIGLHRGQVFYLNAVSCRPPANATPGREHLERCRGHFDAQLALCMAPYILAAGAVGLGQFMPGAKITAWVGYPFAWERFIVYPVLHPAAALRAGTMAAWRSSLDGLWMLMEAPGILAMFPPRCGPHAERDCAKCYRKLDRSRLGLGWERRKVVDVRGQLDLI